MKIYASLFAYLNKVHLRSNNPRLAASQRPIVVLESESDLSVPPWLIPLADKVYEIGFPYLNPTELKDDNYALEAVFNLDISEQSYPLYVNDEVLDLETIKQAAEIPEWESRLKERLDRKTSELIRLFIGMFTEIFGYQQVENTKILLIDLPEKLELANVEDANLPIVISLDKKYQLRRKIELISDKLRHQLRRQAELIPVGRIQEMDSYCLRDYVRRPGLSAVEKAGSKQQLMGIQRYQDFNTPENKFLVYFSQILSLNCFQYERSSLNQFREEIRKIGLAIDLFKQQPIVKTIQDRKYKFTQPNYILQQNPIYRSFYQAYLEYLQKIYEKEKLWIYRNRLLADSVYIYLTAALLKLQGVSLDSNLAVVGSLTPDKGRYIKTEENVAINIFLQNQVYVFTLRKPPDDGKIICDWILTLEIHELNSIELETKKLLFPIWVFWYCPNNDGINQIQKYLNRFKNSHVFGKAIVFYLQNTHKEFQEFISEELSLVQLSEKFIEQGSYSIVDMIANMIASLVNSSVELKV